MENFNFINLNQLTWAFNVAIAGGIFSVFSLIYNQYYIYYGFFTFAFGILVHVSVNFYDWIFHIDENHKYVDQKKYWIAHATYLVLFIAWIYLISRFYKLF
jgi:hypothetical protein